MPRHSSTSRHRAANSNSGCASRSTAILYGSALHAMSPSATDLQAGRRRGRSNAASGVLHAILTPRIEEWFAACNMAPGLETWRAFHIARNDCTQ